MNQEIRDLERELYEIMLPWQRAVLALPRRARLLRIKVPSSVIDCMKRLHRERNELLGQSRWNQFLDTIPTCCTYFGAEVVETVG